MPPTTTINPSAIENIRLTDSFSSLYAFFIHLVALLLLLLYFLCSTSFFRLSSSHPHIQLKKKKKKKKISARTSKVLLQELAITHQSFFPFRPKNQLTTSLSLTIEQRLEQQQNMSSST
jgi:di/tricarboxylate transporter